jgi:hypothetical protein
VGSDFKKQNWCSTLLFLGAREEKARVNGATRERGEYKIYNNVYIAFPIFHLGSETS